MSSQTGVGRKSAVSEMPSAIKRLYDHPRRSNLRVGIAHDWLLNRRGAERVLWAFSDFLQPSSIYTLFLRTPNVDPRILRFPIHRSRFDRLPLVQHYYRYLLPLFPRAAESMTVTNVDLLLSIHHSVAKGIRYVGNPLHICYCLTPMRHLWKPSLYEHILDGSWRGQVMRLFEKRLKKWDLESNQNVDHFVAISNTVQKRIAQIYGRHSKVIYPGVDVDFFVSTGLPRDDFYLMVTALVPQKRVDLAVDAFGRCGRPIVIAGDGPLRRTLQNRAGPNIKFLGRVSDDTVCQLYNRARALVFPGVEDFGLVPVEAQACGCPVIAFGQGGVTESVSHEETGLFFSEATPDSLIQSVERFEGLRFSGARIRENAMRFSLKTFRNNWAEYLADLGVRIGPSGGFLLRKWR